MKDQVDQATVENDEVLKIVREKMDLFHDHSQAFATVEVDGHSETHAVPSESFARILIHLMMQNSKRIPSIQTMNARMPVIAAMAIGSRTERNVCVRIGGIAEKLYLDLGDSTWRVVEIDANGWRILEGNCPIRFQRPEGMEALQTPVAGGSIEDLKKILNLVDKDDFYLFVVWLLAAFRNRGPYPILSFCGPPGSAKSTTARLSRSLIDPNLAPLRTPPADLRDLAITATNSWVPTFDNVSNLPQQLSDALCRLSTGGGFSVRKLYTDRGESIFSFQRPVILTSIHSVIRKSDLLDRTLTILLARVSDSTRTTERALDEHFHQMQSKLLGALLDALSSTLRHLPDINLPNAPRMADFAHFGVAVELSLRWEPGSFLAAYLRSSERANQIASSSSPVFQAMKVLALPWTGTATQLLALLNSIADQRTRRSKYWPRSANRLSSEIKRIQAGLLSERIFVQTFREPTQKRERRILVRAAN